MKNVYLAFAALCLGIAPHKAAAQQAVPGLTANFTDEIVVTGYRIREREEVDWNVPLERSVIPGDQSGQVTYYRPFWQDGPFSVGGEVNAAPDDVTHYGPAPVRNQVPRFAFRIILNPIRDEERPQRF